MANNQYVNKVEFGNETLIDITDTTADTGDVLEGEVFYAKSGARSVGTLGDATTSTHGLMSANDKSKLDEFLSASNYLTSHQDIGGKADKVTSATNGNFAALDSNGNLTDSGHKHSDYLTSIPTASNTVKGGVVIDSTLSPFTIWTHPSTHLPILTMNFANAATIQAGNAVTQPFAVSRQHEAIFFGLSKVAGVDLANETVTLGTYPDTAKAAIQSMLGVPSISDLSTKANSSDIPVEYGTGIGSVKQKNYTYNNTTYSNITSGIGSVAIGRNNNITGAQSIAFGEGNTISGERAFAFGEYINISENDAVAFGYQTQANCINMVAMGKYNELANTVINNWATNTYYIAGELVKAKIGNNTIRVMCKKSHLSTGSSMSDDLDENNQSLWKMAPSNGDIAFCIGNGTGTDTLRANALKINFGGTAFFGGDLFVQCDGHSENGVKVATITDIPSVPVQDVQVDNTSILSNGIANIPYATTSQLGLVKPDGVSISIMSGLTGQLAILNGKISIICADDTQIKEGNNTLVPIPTYRQHMSVFYGLSKAAGIDLASETVTFGIYPDTSKGAIQSMLGINSALAPVENSTTTSQVYNIGELFSHNGKLYKVTSGMFSGEVITPGTNCAETTVAAEILSRTAQVEVIRL